MNTSGENNQMFLVCGYSAAGKTASLRNIRDQEDWIYFGCEAGKGIPFKHKFNYVKISDPKDLLESIYEIIEDEKDPKNKPYKGIIIDSIDFLMNQFESLYCYNVQDSRKGWQDYSQYFQELLQFALVAWNKPVICIAHLQTDMQNETNVMLSHVPVKGSLRWYTVESYFNVVIYARKMSVPELKPYEKDNDLLHISDRERQVGVKYVFQTLPTKLDHNNTIRGPMDLFTDNETYVDNDCQLILDKLNSYYGEN